MTNSSPVDHGMGTQSEVSPNRTPAGNIKNQTTAMNSKALGGFNPNKLIRAAKQGGLQLHPTYHRSSDGGAANQIPGNATPRVSTQVRPTTPNID